MRQYLLRQVDQAAQRWEAGFEARTTPEQIAACQKQLRERLWQVLGGPPPRTPLNARTTGKVQRDGYLVEKVIFESQPGFHVTALLFLPDAARFGPVRQRRSRRVARIRSSEPGGHPGRPAHR
jgi:hypothetical protein